MMDLAEKDYVVVLQCHIVKQRCSGYGCERAFHLRDGGFAAYGRQKQYRLLTITCGGCCGRATHRKLGHLLRKLKKEEDLGRERVVVQLSSCMTQENYHSPRCPHLDYVKALLGRLKVDCREDTVINELSQQRRQKADGGKAGAQG